MDIEMPFDYMVHAAGSGESKKVKSGRRSVETSPASIKSQDNQKPRPTTAEARANYSLDLHGSGLESVKEGTVLNLIKGVEDDLKKAITFEDLDALSERLDEASKTYGDRLLADNFTQKRISEINKKISGKRDNLLLDEARRSLAR